MKSKPNLLPFGALDTKPMISVTVGILRTNVAKSFPKSGTSSEKPKQEKF